MTRPPMETTRNLRGAAAALGGAALLAAACSGHGPGGLGFGGAHERAFNVQQTHRNGSQLIVKKLTLQDTAVTVELVAINGLNQAIKLNSSQDMAVRDGAGNAYALVPPVANPDVEVRPGEVLRGTFRFYGPRPTEAGQTYYLITNSKYGSSDADYSTTPKFTFTLAPAAK